MWKLTGCKWKHCLHWIRRLPKDKLASHLNPGKLGSTFSGAKFAAHNFSGSNLLGPDLLGPNLPGKINFLEPERVGLLYVMGNTSLEPPPSAMMPYMNSPLAGIGLVLGHQSHNMGRMESLS